MDGLSEYYCVYVSTEGGPSVTPIKMPKPHTSVTMAYVYYLQHVYMWLITYTLI